MDHVTPTRFAIRAFVFTIPVIVCVLVWQAMLWRVGENWPMDHVIDVELAEKKTVFKRAYVAEEMRRYRFENLLRRKPEIIAFGSSTTMEFRGEMFGPHAASFYNAGGLLQRPKHFVEVLNELEKHDVKPKVLVVGIDPWWLTIPYKKGTFADVSSFRERSALRQDIEATMNAFRVVPIELLTKREQTMQDLFDSEPMHAGRLGIGVTARHGTGFRGDDGSYRYEYYIKRTLEDGVFADRWNTVAQIETGTGRFMPLEKPRKENYEALDAFLKLAHDKDIVVGLFLIPMAPITHDALEKSDKHQQHLQNYRSLVGELAAKHDMPLVDATQPADWGFDKRYMIDGFHASEVVMARIIAELLRDDRFAAALPGLTPEHPQSLIDDPNTRPGFLGYDAR